MRFYPAGYTEFGRVNTFVVVGVHRHPVVCSYREQLLATDDHDKRLGYGVLEYKSTNRKAAAPGRLTRLGLCPLKLSKFLWATEV
jgi:hypothetical protein